MKWFMAWPRPVLIALIALVPVLGAQTSEEPKVVSITAKRFEYSPKEVHLKKGETVTLLLKSEDVTHGFLSRKLKLDTDIPPGQELCYDYCFDRETDPAKRLPCRCGAAQCTGWMA